MLQRVLTLAAALGIATAFAHRLPAQDKPPQATGPDTVVYTTTRGTVILTHAKHARLSDCSACHHESRPERPYTKSRQACGSCHTAEPAAPVTTNLKNAFHNIAAKTGVCYDCHVKEAAAGKAAPTACNDCHKRQGN